ncbi:hypothetical protein JCM8208_001551 [Rhodotorula glutinis]
MDVERQGQAGVATARQEAARPPSRRPRCPPPTSPGASSNPSVVTSPLPPFPAEVFSNVLSFLSQKDAAPLCRVSRSWNHHISNDARLWSTLVTYLDSRDDDDMCRAVCLRASTTAGGGGIRVLRLVLGSVRDPHGRRVDTWPKDAVVEQARRVLDLVAQASVSVSAVAHGPSAAAMPPRTCSSLRTLDVELFPNTSTSLYVLDLIAKQSRAPIFSNLREARFQVAAPDFDLSGSFLKMFPTVTTFEFKAEQTTYTTVPIPVGHWAWENPHSHAVPSLDHLETLKLSHVWVGEDIDLPRLPSLKRLELHDVKWDGSAIFLLLRLARRTLECIIADRVQFEPAHDAADNWLEYVHVKDTSLVEAGDLASPFHQTMNESVPILLPVLRHLEIHGPTPAFFATLETAEASTSYDDDYFPTPILRMPVLDRCIMSAVDVDSLFEDEALGALAVLGRNAPLVTHLELNSIVTSDWQMHCCLASMSAKVTTLDLYHSTITDWLIAKLPHLVPSLKYLDVRCCEEVTPQGVARMVEVIRDLNDEGQSKVEKVFLDRPTGRSTLSAVAAYRWLDFVGVLQRDESDYEGAGPLYNVEARRKWLKEGKKDRQWETKEFWAQREAEQRERERVALERARAAGLFVGGSGASGGSSSRGGGDVGSSAAGPCVSFAPPREGPSSLSQAPFVPYHPAHSIPPLPFGPAQPTSTPMRPQHHQYAVQPIPPHRAGILSSHFLPSLPAQQQQQQPWSPSVHEQAHTYSPTPRPSAPAPPAAFAPRVAPPPLVAMPAPRHLAAAAAAAAVADARTDTSSIEDADDDLEADYSWLDDADGGASHLDADYLRAQQDTLARMTAARDDEMLAQVQEVVRREREAADETAQEQEREQEQGRRDEAQAAAVLVLARQQGFRAAATAAAAGAPPVQPGPPSQDAVGAVFQGFAGDGDSSTDDDDDDDDDMVVLDDGSDARVHEDPFEALV